MNSQLLSVLAWYLAALAGGFVALPLSFRLFRHLPDRGYTFSKALGLLATGWVFWFLGSLGFLRNDAPGVLFAGVPGKVLRDLTTEDAARVAANSASYVEYAMRYRTGDLG